ncbi:MAG: hypothetical protein NVSMB64_06950 [Candidatus Velthaea sp.]
MDIFEILLSIFSGIAENAKKNRARQAERTAQMRAAFTGGAPVPAVQPAAQPMSLEPRVALRATQPVARRVDLPDAAVPEERRLVNELLATPRSLAAAFVAAEILQPPVALR